MKYFSYHIDIYTILVINQINTKIKRNIVTILIYEWICSVKKKKQAEVCLTFCEFIKPDFLFRA